MMITKKQYSKEDGIQGFHIIQSFAEGEVTPELAHKIGVDLAKELFEDRFEVIVATHLNTNYYHNHILLNSVSFLDGKRYYDTRTNYAIIRKTSDHICEEHGLSVIEEQKNKFNYEKIYNGKVCATDYYITTKEDIDKTIEQAGTYNEFLAILKSKGYEIFFRAEKISLRRYPHKRNIRILRAFGSDYSIDNIKNRISKTLSKELPFPEEYSKRKTNYRGTKIKSKTKPTGIYKLFLYYCYLLKIFPKKYPNKYLSPEIRADIKQMDKFSEEARLLSRNKIQTTKQLFSYKSGISKELANLKAQRENLYYELKRKKNCNNIEAQNQIAVLSDKINCLKEQEMMCDEIKNRIPKIKENVEKQENYNKERSKVKDEYFK